MKPGGEVGPRAGSTGVNVWDPLVLIFHWSLLVAFTGAWWLGDDGGLAHQAFGYTVLALIGLRLFWGVVGSHHARFSSFVPPPRRLWNYTRDVMARREARHLGHNPLGAAMIVALLVTLAAIGISGWLQTTDAFWGNESIDTLHVLLVNIALVLIGLHVAGVTYSSLRHRENLVCAMFSGRKRSE